MENFFVPETVENATGPSIESRATGTVIRVSVDDPAIAKVIEAGFDRILLERTMNQGISWQEITKGDERLVLRADQTTYVFTDRGGSVEYFYRTRYTATKGELQGQCSDPSEAIVGAGLAVRNVLTVEELKDRYFFGIDITDDSGKPLSDLTFLHYIIKSIRYVEHVLDIPILPTAFTDKHDYHRGDYEAFNFLKLDNSPVIQIDSFRAMYPSGSTIIEYPPEWMRLNKESGQLQIVPTAGTLSQVLLGAGGSFLPAIYNGMPYLPHLFEVDYIAGFEDGRLPRNITDVIGMFAAIGPFNIFGDLITGAGIGNLSLSMDGLSQSITTTQSAMYGGYGSRVDDYRKQVKDELKMLRLYYKGIGMTVA